MLFMSQRWFSRRPRLVAWLLLGSWLSLAPEARPQSQPILIKDAVRYDAGSLGFAGVGNENQNDNFGQAAANLGDLDGDGVIDIAFGHPRDDDVDDPGKLIGSQSGKFSNNGALWILFLNADGTVKNSRKISSASLDAPPLDADNAPPGLGPEDNIGVRGFGQAVDSIGDLDGDGVTDLIVGVNEDDDGTLEQLCDSCGFSQFIDVGFGSLFVLFMDTDGTIKSYQKISKTMGGGGLGALLNIKDYFGSAVADMGDFNGDGFHDVLVGAPGTHKTNPTTGQSFTIPHVQHLPSTGLGRVWVLSLHPDGTLFRRVPLDLPPGFLDGASSNEYGDEFGRSVAWLGDIDGPGAGSIDDPVNSMTSIAVGAPFDDDGPPSPQGRYGAVWILGLDFTDTSLSIVEAQKISETFGGFEGGLTQRDLFGMSMDPAGDWNGDGIPDLAVGAPFDDDGWADAGAVYILMLNKDGSVKTHLKISDTPSGIPDSLVTNGLGVNFGSAVASVGDFDDNGTRDFIAGAELYDPLKRGAGWLVTTDVPRLTLGDRLDGVVAADNSYVFTFEATAGTVLSITAIQKLSEMEPALRIYGPLTPGVEPAVLADVADTTSTKNSPKAKRKAKLPKGFSVPATGEYLLEVLDVSGNGGAFRMKTKGKPAKSVTKVVQIIELGVGDTTVDVSFDATSGSLLKKLSIKALKPKGDFALIDGQPAALLPVLDQVLDPKLQALPLVAPPKVNKAGTAVSINKQPLDRLGTYTVQISANAGSVGYAKLTATIKILKGKAKLVLP